MSVARDDPADSLGRFSRAADTASTDVIRTYSTSFGLATKLLGERHRQHVRNIYAMVRIADEIVDGAGTGSRVRWTPSRRGWMHRRERTPSRRMSQRPTAR